MHIGVLTHNYPRFPGDFSGTFVEALCAELAAQGQQITVWAPYDPAYRRSPDGAVDLRLYRYAWPDSLHQLGYMRSMQSDLALRLNAYLLSPAFFAAGVARVVSDAARLRPDVLHAHWLLPNGFVAAVASRLLGIPLVVSVPGSDAQVAGSNPLFRSMARFALAQASLVTANSEALAEAVAALAPGAGAPSASHTDTPWHVPTGTAPSPRTGTPWRAPTEFDLIIYGTDPAALRPDSRGVAELRRRLELPDGAAVLLAVGRMVYKKGFDVLIRALAEPPLAQRNVAAVLVGEGDQKAEWQALAAELGVAERLRWAGTVPKDEIGRYYNLADALVMPSVSRPADGLNVCVLDAMSCAKPVVASPAAGNRLAVAHGESGWIVPEGEPAALAEALAVLLENPELARHLGEAGRQRVETELGWPHLARRYIAHFERLAAASRLRP